MRSPLVSLIAAGTLVAGCVMATGTPMPRLDIRTGASRTVRQDFPEAQVEKARLQATLGILSGITAVPGGKLIPDRGGAEGREMARKYLIATMESLGFNVERQRYRNSGENLIATLPATVKTEETILIGAHMDSVRNKGADDDGSGSVAILEAARVLRGVEDRKANLMVAWFDEEELGLIGSNYMAKEFKKQGKNIVFMHQVDMLGYDKDGDGAIEVARPEADLWDYYQMVNTKHGLNIKLERTSTGQSDHVSFAKQGYKSVLLIEEYVGGDTTPFYHKPTDTYQTVNFDYLTQGTRLLTAVVSDQLHKVRAPQRPFIPHTQFPGKDLHCGPDHQH